MPKYFVDGQPVEVELDSDYVAVKFKPARRSAMARATSEVREAGSYENRIDVPEFGLTLLPTDPSPTTHGPAGAARSRAAVRGLRASSAVERAGPVYRRGRTRLVPTGRVVYAFKPDTDASLRDRVADEHGLTVLSESRYGELTAELREVDADVFQVAEALTARPEIEFAEPDLITITPRHPNRALPPPHLARSPTAGTWVGAATPMPRPTDVGPDPLAGQQYYLGLLQVDAALAEVTPDPGIVIAILDEGVDTKHPDLGGILRGYDGTDDDEIQEPKAHDAHGTACAGIVGATANNRLGVRGVAAGCSMLAVRIAYSDNTGENWVSTNQWIARSIDWSWENGADVLSNSWGGGSPSNEITRAFSRARTRGRGGRGAVVVVAAGNDDLPVDFPGNLSGILTVAASNQDDQPKTKTSSDGEYWWGSNYGPEVDVAAPGVGIATTDISGDRGYNRSGSAGDYVLNFNGTSSACPQVAAICALVLSKNPELNEAEVRTIVRESADPVGSVIYDPSTGHNPRMGRGRANALRAVRRARPSLDSGTDLERSPGLSIPDADPAGVADAVEVTALGLVKDLSVEVDISHTYRGDLRVILIPPDGTEILLHDRQGGSSNHLRATYTPAVAPGLARWLERPRSGPGVWTLRVIDLASWDVGRLERWRLKLDLEAPAKEASLVVVPTNGLIPDNQPEGLTSEAQLELPGAISEVSVRVEITHTWRGDLEVDLLHRDKTLRLHDRAGGSADNLFETFTSASAPLSELIGVEASGRWALRVADRAARDTGKLARWTLDVKVR